MIDHVHYPPWRKPTLPFVLSNRAIRLAPGAVSQIYNPWRRRKPPLKARRITTLWADFAELVRRIQCDQLRPYFPSPAGIERILKWSSDFGLLGILCGPTSKIVLPAIYGWSQVAPERPWQAIIQSTHRQITGGNWITTYQQVSCENDPKFKEGALVGDSTFQKAELALFDWSTLTERPSFRILRRYFSTPCKNNQFPLPLSEHFWASYQEPVFRWMVEAERFQQSVTLVSQHARDQYQQGPRSGETHGPVNDALWYLNALASGLTSLFAFGAYAIEERKCAASLLSIMARMFFEDLDRNRLAYNCVRCQTIFVTTDRKSQYCSRTCRNTVSVSRYRTKAKEALKNAALTQTNAGPNAK